MESPVDQDGSPATVARRVSIIGSQTVQVQGGSLASSVTPSRQSSFGALMVQVPKVSKLVPLKSTFVPRFMTKRLVSPHGERMLTSLKGVCQKVEILAVLPQIMSRLALGDFELEVVLGEECVEAVLQLLYIQMHWIECRNVGAPPFKFMGSTLQNIKKRLHQGVQARSTKIKFDAPQQKKREYRHMEDAEQPLKDEDHPEFTQKQLHKPKPETKYNQAGIPIPEPGSEEAEQNKKAPKCKKPKPLPLTTNEEKTLEVWKQAELSRTRTDTIQAMKKLMTEAYGTKVSPMVKDQIIRDFFYETIVRETSRRKHEQDVEAKKARIRQRARIRKKTHYHTDHHHVALEEVQETDVEDTSGEEDETNPMDQLLSDDDLDIDIGAPDEYGFFGNSGDDDRKGSSSSVQAPTRENSADVIITDSAANMVRTSSSEADPPTTQSDEEEQEHVPSIPLQELKIVYPNYEFEVQEEPEPQFMIQDVDDQSDYNDSRQGSFDLDPNMDFIPRPSIRRTSMQLPEELMDTFAKLLADPEKTKFLRRLIKIRRREMEKYDNLDHEAVKAIEKKRLQLVTRALEGRYRNYVRHALKRKDINELLFLLRMDKRNRRHGQTSTLMLDATQEEDKRAFEKYRASYLENQRKSMEPATFMPPALSQRSSFTPQTYELTQSTQDVNKLAFKGLAPPDKPHGVGWRLVQETPSKLYLTKTWKNEFGEIETRKIRLNKYGQPESQLERKERRLLKMEKRMARNRRIQALQNTYGPDVPRVVYEKHERSKETNGKYQISSDDSESSCGEDEEMRIKVTDPFPYDGPNSLKAALIAGKRPVTSDFPGMVGLPEQSESFKLGSIRLLTANYNMGRVAAINSKWMGPELFGIPKDQYMGDQLKAAYREVMRLLSLNEDALTWFVNNLKPEVTQAVKLFYSQVQILEGLMYARLLMSPEEDISRLHFLKQTWIREQRLLRRLKGLEGDLEGLNLQKQKMMFTLNTNINDLISQIDSAYQQAHHEVNRISSEAAKVDLLNSKFFDQEIQQLDGQYAKALKFGTSLRYKLNEIESQWRKRRFKLEAELEAVIDRYDSEMSARQEIFDEAQAEEDKNKKEIGRVEGELKDVERRYGNMMEEIRLKELADEMARRKKKKKKGKGKKGKKGAKGKGKKGKGKGAKGKKGKKGKGKGKKRGGSKKRKGKKKKKGKKGETDDEEEEEIGEYETDEEEGQSVEVKGAKKGKGKKKAKKPKSPKKEKPKSPKGKKGKGTGKKKVGKGGKDAKKGSTAPATAGEMEGEGADLLLDDLDLDEEEEEGEEGSVPPKSAAKKGKVKKGAKALEGNAGATSGKPADGAEAPASAKKKKGTKKGKRKRTGSRKKKSKKGKGKPKKAPETAPPPTAV